MSAEFGGPSLEERGVKSETPEGSVDDQARQYIDQQLKVSAPNWESFLNLAGGRHPSMHEQVATENLHLAAERLQHELADKFPAAKLGVEEINTSIDQYIESMRPAKAA